MEGTEGMEGLDANSPSGEGLEDGSSFERLLTRKERRALERAERKAADAGMRAERAADTLLARVAKRRKWVGSWNRYMEEAVARHKGPVAQVDYVFGHVEVQSLHGRDRIVSVDSADKKYRDVSLMYRELAKLPEGRGVPNILAIRRKHILAVIKHWQVCGRAASTLSNRISNIRDWMARMGKPDVVPDGHEWEVAMREAGIDTRGLRRSGVAKVAKDWKSSGVDALAVIEKVFAECEIVGSQLLLQYHFGARVRESYSSIPVLDLKGDTYYFDKGTKGGRPRAVKLSDDPVIRERQMAAYERIKAVAAKHPKRYLARKGDTAKETRSHYYYVIRKCGITKEELGVVSHGLRHEYMGNRYEGVTGLPAPVHNAAPARLYRELGEAEKAARQLVSEEAGHWREDASSPYIGSVPSTNKRQEANRKANLKLLQGRADVDQAFRDFGARTVWFTGSAANGFDMDEDERLTIAVLVAEDKGRAEVTALSEQMTTLTGKPFTAYVVYSELHAPSDGLEVILLSQSKPTGKAA